MIHEYDEKKAFYYENGFMLTSEIYRIGNFLAHYELYKKIIELPGDIVELGVFKGNSLIQFASFRELLENEKSRKIIGFDIFGEFPSSIVYESDRQFVSGWNKNYQNDFLSQEDLYRSFELKNVKNIELVKGNIFDTLEDYKLKHPHMKISLLHIDTDVYEPSKLALELLYDLVVSGGVIILDDYGTVEGETRAVDEFFADKECQLKKFTFSHTKPSYIIKE